MWKPIVGKAFTQSGFDSYVSGLAFTAWRPQFVVLHNTAIPTFADWHKVAGEQRMKNFEHYYRYEKKWSAGPHLFVADDLIWVFTPLTTSGVHSPSWNRVSWGVEIAGDYCIEALSSVVRDNVVSALATLHHRAGLDPSTLKLHHEDPLTTHHCPGDKIGKADVIEWLTAAIASKVDTFTG
jgi:hypothetical protein